MTTRVSTASLQLQALSALLGRQANLAKLREQIDSGSKLVTAADNPVMAGVAVALDRANAAYAQYEINGNALKHRLTLEESALASVGDRLARIREIAIQANSGVQTESSRRAYVSELREQFEAILGLANSTDGQGRYLFGGSNDASVPFAKAGGSVAYSGDQSQRRIEVSPASAVQDTDPGSEVFLRIRNGDGRAVARAEPANVGTLTLKVDGVADPGQWDGGRYRVEFNGGNWEVRDAGGSTIATGPYVPGETIAFRGYRMECIGAPVDGDAFDVAPSAPQDVFSTIQALIATVQMPGFPAANQAEQQNAFYGIMQDLARADEHIIDKRAGVGARLATLDSIAEEREAQVLATRTTLAGMRDLDYAQAITQLRQEEMALEASQLSFNRIQSLSLFSLLR